MKAGRFQYRLRDLLVLITVCSVLCSFAATTPRLFLAVVVVVVGTSLYLAGIGIVALCGAFVSLGFFNFAVWFSDRVTNLLDRREKGDCERETRTLPRNRAHGPRDRSDANP
jgi:hypothetical protein